MPTEMGSPLFAGWRSEKDAASVRALRDAGAVIIGKTVTTEFAASEPRGTRNPWNTRTHARRLVERLGGVRRRRHRQRGARHAGDRFDRAAGELLRLRRFQAERERAQPRRQSRLSEPELHRNSRLRRSKTPGRSPTRSSRALAAMPARPACKGRARRRQRRSRERSRCWKRPDGTSRRAGAKRSLDECVARLKSAGVEIRTRHNDKNIAALETELRNAHGAVAPLQRL